MNRLSLARRLRLILIGIALCGLLFYLILLPWLLARLLPDDPIILRAHLILLWISGIPCYTVLYHGWNIVRNIAADRSFCSENARRMRSISTLAMIDTAYIPLCDLILFLLGGAEGIILLLSAVIIFVGIAVSTVAAALSHLILRAAELQELDDLTV
jgi:hypothetical protein